MRRLAEPRPDASPAGRPRSTSAHWAAFSGCGRTRKPASANGSPRRAARSIQLRTKSASFRRDEPRRADVEHDGRSARRPTSRQNSSRLRLGSRSNQGRRRRSGQADPLGGMRCSSRASSACRSFQTSTGSGASRSRPLFVRLSQPRTGNASGSRAASRREVVGVRCPDRQQMRQQQRRPASARPGTPGCAAAARAASRAPAVRA